MDKKEVTKKIAETIEPYLYANGFSLKSLNRFEKKNKNSVICLWNRCYEVKNKVFITFKTLFAK